MASTSEAGALAAAQGGSGGACDARRAPRRPRPPPLQARRSEAHARGAPHSDGGALPLLLLLHAAAGVQPARAGAEGRPACSTLRPATAPEQLGAPHAGAAPRARSASMARVAPPPLRRTSSAQLGRRAGRDDVGFAFWRSWNADALGDVSGRVSPEI
jgi:hypothetical protein